MGTQARTRLLRRLEKTINKTACSNDLGDFGFVILNSIQAMSPSATVNSVLRMVLQETGDLLDVAQTYVAIDRFKDDDRKWVRETGKEVSTQGGRPMATFAITKEGREAIRNKTEHMERLLKFQARAAELSIMTAQQLKQEKLA